MISPQPGPLARPAPRPPDVTTSPHQVCCQHTACHLGAPPARLPPGCPASPPATWVPCQPALLGQLLLIFQKAASVSPFLDISPRPPSLDAHRVFFFFHFIFKQTFLFKILKKKKAQYAHMAKLLKVDKII